MKKSKLLITLLILSILIPSYLISYNFFKPKPSKKQCATIRENFSKIKIGMSKEEVLLLIGKNPYYKIYPNLGVSPEPKDRETWLLCSDPDSCTVHNIFLKTCTSWQMVSFDPKTEKVFKAFYDSPDRVGF